MFINFSRFIFQITMMLYTYFVDGSSWELQGLLERLLDDNTCFQFSGYVFGAVVDLERKQMKVYLNFESISFFFFSFGDHESKSTEWLSNSFWRNISIFKSIWCTNWAHHAIHLINMMIGNEHKILILRKRIYI